jgi:nitroreductase
VNKLNLVISEKLASCCQRGADIEGMIEMLNKVTAEDFAAHERIVNARHSCRAFKPDVVGQETILKILNLSQRSASDCNVQPWQVTVVSGAALDRLRKEIYLRASSGLPIVSDVPPIDPYVGVYKERRRDCGWSLYGTLGIQKGDRVASGQQALENFRFFGAPHVAIITAPSVLGPRGILDCGGYVASFMLAAQSLGVATITQASISHRADVIREQLNIPTGMSILCGIAFGWSDEEHLANSFRTQRASLDETVRFVS